MAFINTKIEELINYRIAQEEQSSRLYLAMSKWFLFNGYTGAAKLWNKYSEEEMSHAKKAYEYLEDLDILPKVPAFTAPKCEFTDLLNIVKESYEHELTITKQCNELAKQAVTLNDYMTLALAQWYLTEQVEEISKITSWLDLIHMQGGESMSKESLMLIDTKMGL